MVQPIKYEMDVYLKESVFICEDGSDTDFDTLDFRTMESELLQVSHLV